MSSRAKTIVAYMTALPVALALAYGLISMRFVTRVEADQIRADVGVLKTDMRELKAGVELGNCLQLAERQGEPWQACMRQ